MKSKGRRLNEWFSEWESKQICRWIDSRKAYRKARWLRELNRLIDRWEGKLFGG